MPLKGSTLIELTNVKTGEVERYRDDNMITDALSMIMKPIGYQKGYGAMNDANNICVTFMGGLVLFDTAIEEKGSTCYAPGEAGAVGYAAYQHTNTTTDNTLGSCNLTETELNTSGRYMKMVFEFSTAQANGNINSVCLTHPDAAKYAMYGSPTNTQASQTFYYMHNGWSGHAILSDSAQKKETAFSILAEHPFLVDADDDAVYYFSVPDPSIIRITKRRGNLLSVPVVVAHKSNKALIETFDINLPAAINTTYVAWNFEVDEDCLYICTATGTTIASKGTMKVARIYLDDRRSEYFEVVNNTGVALESNSNFFAYIHQGLVYVKTSGNVVYTINLTDPTDWTKLSGTLKTSSCRPVAAQNGRVMYFYYSYANYGTDSSYLSIANGKRKMVETPTANGMHSCGSGVYYRQYIPYRDGFHWAGPSNCCYIKNYIATINNLSRTIEKTSDKTMKITYTIQEV